MEDNVEYLPIWKANSTPEEKLLEIAMVARKHPERFTSMVLIYQEDSPDGCQTRFAGTQTLNLNETLGILELGKYEILREAYGVRESY